MGDTKFSRLFHERPSSGTSRGNSSKEPMPSADLVVVSKMRREYTVAGERRYISKMGDVYFHPNMSNIKNKQAHFLPSLLTVRSHVRQLLTPLYRQHLMDSRIFSIKSSYLVKCSIHF